MRKLLLFVLLFSPFAADLSLAQANAFTIVCDECRDPDDYPDDYVNFAFNQVYGPDGWMNFDQADDFFIANLANQRVYVDIDFLMLGIGVEGLRLPFWPTNLVQVRLALPNGNLYTALRSVFQTSLPVPASADREQSDSNTGDNSSGGGEGGADGEDYEHDDTEGYDWDDLEIEEYEGNTWIEDPDEDGNFDEADWCEEC